MSDYYKILGVDRNAGQDEIKKAYRKLAAQHHPDRGGDTAKFQEIQVAYDTLGDPEKRSRYDNPAPEFGDGGFFNQGNGMPPGFEDIFAQMFAQRSPFGFNFGNQPRPQRNKTLNIQTTISLEDAFFGKDIIANLTLPTGRDQMLEIKIPQGVQDGTILRLAGMGDDTWPNQPRGDIHLSIQVAPHNKFQRNGDDLICNLDLNCFDAMIGKNVPITTLDGKTLELNVRPGTQHGQMLSAAGYGMPKMSDPRFKGRLLLAVNIVVPTTLTDVQKQIIKEHFQ